MYIIVYCAENQFLSKRSSSKHPGRHNQQEHLWMTWPILDFIISRSRRSWLSHSSFAHCLKLSLKHCLYLQFLSWSNEVPPGGWTQILLYMGWCEVSRGPGSDIASGKPGQGFWLLTARNFFEDRELVLIFSHSGALSSRIKSNSNPGSKSSSMTGTPYGWSDSLRDSDSRVATSLKSPGDFGWYVLILFQHSAPSCFWSG